MYHNGLDKNQSVQSILDYAASPRPIRAADNQIKKEVSIDVEALNHAEAKAAEAAATAKAKEAAAAKDVIQDAVEKKPPHKEGKKTDEEKKKEQLILDIRVYVTFVLLILLTAGVVVGKIFLNNESYPSGETNLLQQEVKSNIMYAGMGFLNEGPDFISNDYPVSEDEELERISNNKVLAREKAIELEMKLQEEAEAQSRKFRELLS